jgi:hypothetical protein
MSIIYKENKKLIDRIISDILKTRDAEGFNSIAFIHRSDCEVISRKILIKENILLDKIMDIEDAVWYKILDKRDKMRANLDKENY